MIDSRPSASGDDVARMKFIQEGMAQSDRAHRMGGIEGAAVAHELNNPVTGHPGLRELLLINRSRSTSRVTH